MSIYYPPHHVQLLLSHRRNESADSVNDDDVAPDVKTLAVLGTGSDVGKTTLVAGICRILSRKGIRVAPFKAQNMSNNATPALLPTLNKKYSSEDSLWGEIGTAQALQARACGLIPRVEMNPVLLKSGGRRDSDGAYLCSVLVMGKHIAKEDYGALGTRTEELRSMVIEAHHSLAQCTNSELIVVEGAGSCTELNLMERDIVNLPLVRKLRCQWLLVADIDKGGVFAQIVGTKYCVTEEDWELCCGIVVNRLRGDAKYFQPGPKMIEDMVKKPVFVVPWVYNLDLPEEDGLGVESRLKREHEQLSRGKANNSLPVIVVVAYPHIAIDSDLLPLEQDRDNVLLDWRRDIIPKPYPETDAIVLPGSRLTCSDLKWLMEDTQWGTFIVEHVQLGGAVLGLCGGYQMLGSYVQDLSGVEGTPGTRQGLGLLPVHSSIEQTNSKIVRPCTANLLLGSSKEVVHGFELHCGITTLEEGAEPLLYNHETKQHDGSKSGKVSGCYMHGILENHTARNLLLHLPADTKQKEDAKPSVSDALDRLADHLEDCGLTSQFLANCSVP